MFKSGVTIVELIVVTFIFSLFMLGIYTSLEVGLKSWQLGEAKADVYQKAQAILYRITRDYSYSDIYNTQIHQPASPGNYHEYVCFQTPLKSDGSIDVDKKNFGAAVWQGHILYYIKPRFEENSSPDLKRTLYRCFLPKSPPSSVPTILTDFPGSYIDNTDLSDSNLKVVSKELYSIDFIKTGVSMKINVCIKKDLSKERTMAFSPGVVEVFTLGTSVNPKN